MIARRRSGFTLIHLVAILTISAFLMGLSISWLNETFDFAKRIRSQKRTHQHLTRLSADLRSDVQLSKTMTCEKGGLVLDLGERRQIKYQIVESGIEKERLIDGEVAARENYRLPACSIIEWQTETMPNQIGLVVYRNFDTRGSFDNTNPELSNEKFRQLGSGKIADLPVDIHIIAQCNRWPIASYSIASYSVGSVSKSKEAADAN